MFSGGSVEEDSVAHMEVGIDGPYSAADIDERSSNQVLVKSTESVTSDDNEDPAAESTQIGINGSHSTMNDNNFRRTEHPIADGNSYSITM